MDSMNCRLVQLEKSKAQLQVGSPCLLTSPQEQIEDMASKVDVATVHSQQLDKKIKQFDKVNGFHPISHVLSRLSMTGRPRLTR